MTRKCKRKALSFPTLTGRDMPKRPARSCSSWFHFHARSSFQRRTKACSDEGERQHPNNPGVSWVFREGFLQRGVSAVTYVFDK